MLLLPGSPLAEGRRSASVLSIETLQCCSITCGGSLLTFASLLPAGEPASLENPTDIHSRSGRDQGCCHEHNPGGCAALFPSLSFTKQSTCSYFFEVSAYESPVHNFLLLSFNVCMPSSPTYLRGRGSGGQSSVDALLGETTGRNYYA